MSRKTDRDRRGAVGRGGRDISSWLIPLAVAALALAVRAPNLGWGLPDIEEEALPMKKALDMWGWSTGQVDWNPRTAGWPSLSFYVHLLLQHLHYGCGRLIGTYADRGDYFVTAWIAPGSLLVTSRALGVLAAGAIAWVGARVAARLAGPVAAILTGTLLALSPLLVEHSQLVEPDILVALWAALAVDRILDIYARGRTRDDVWAGIWIGLGISSKYTPVFLTPALWLSHLLRARRPGAGRSSEPALRPFLAVAVAVVVFAATSPFLLLDLGTFIRDVGRQTIHLTGGHFGQEGRLAGPLAYVFNVLGPGLGWGGFALSVVGLGWAAWKVGGAWWVLLACILPYYLGLAILKTQFPRYMLPLLMPVGVGLGGLVLWIRSLVLPRPARNALLAAAGVVVLAPAATGTWHYHREKARTSTHQLAGRFIADVARDANPSIVAEVLSITLPSARLARVFDEATLAHLSPSQRSRLLGRKSYELTYLPMYTVQPQRSDFYYDLRHLAAYDFVVVSSAVRNRYLADSVRFTAQRLFYRDLERFGELAARFAPGPEARGPEIWIYRIPTGTGPTLERERGPAVLGGDPSEHHLADYLPFIEGAARAAYAKGDWSLAARYYQALLESGDAAGMSEIERLRLMRVVAQLHQRAGHLEQAAGFMERFLARVPDDAEIRKNLDEIHRSLGRGSRRP